MPKIYVMQIECEDGLFGVLCKVDGKEKKFWLTPEEVVQNHIAAQQSAQADTPLDDEDDGSIWNQREEDPEYFS